MEPTRQATNTSAWQTYFLISSATMISSAFRKCGKSQHAICRTSSSALLKRPDFSTIRTLWIPVLCSAQHSLSAVACSFYRAFQSSSRTSKRSLSSMAKMNKKHREVYSTPKSRSNPEDFSSFLHCTPSVPIW